MLFVWRYLNESHAMRFFRPLNILFFHVVVFLPSVSNQFFKWFYITQVNTQRTDIPDGRPKSLKASLIHFCSSFFFLVPAGGSSRTDKIHFIYLFRMLILVANRNMLFSGVAIFWCFQATQTGLYLTFDGGSFRFIIMFEVVVETIFHIAMFVIHDEMRLLFW